MVLLTIIAIISIWTILLYRPKERSMYGDTKFPYDYKSHNKPSGHKRHPRHRHKFLDIDAG